MSDGTTMSWRQVFDDFRPALASYARSRGIREPEDLVQDVFVSAVELHQDFEGDRSGLRSLLFTIAYRRIADEHRRLYRRPEVLVNEHLPLPDPGPSVEDVVDLGDSVHAAMEAFAVLSARERHVLRMRIFEEVTPAQVGKILGLSSGNVRVIPARALVKVREYLQSMSAGLPTQALAVGGVHFELFRYLRTTLPTDGGLGDWIREVQIVAGAEVYPVSTPGGAVASLVPPIDGRATDSISSLISTVAGPGAAKIGAIVSVVALGAVAATPTLSGQPEASSPAVITAVSSASNGIEPAGMILEIVEPALDVAGEDDDLLPTVPIGPGDASAAVDDLVEVPPATEGTQVGITAPEVPATNLPEDLTNPLVDDVVTPLVEETVNPLVDDLVQPLLDDVVEPVVDDLVVPLVEDLVEPAVEDTVGAVVELVEPLTRDVVTPLVDEVDQTLTETISGLRGLLGALRNQPSRLTE